MVYLVDDVIMLYGFRSYTCLTTIAILYLKFIPNVFTVYESAIRLWKFTKLLMDKGKDLCSCVNNNSESYLADTAVNLLFVLYSFEHI